MKKQWMLPAALAAGLGALALYERYLPPVRKKEKFVYPYGLLLGCPCHEDGTYSTSQKARCQLAVQAWKQGLYKTLIISGGAVKNQYCESESMARYIQAHGGQDIPILLETEASSTWANLDNCRPLVQDQPVLIMTGSLHARRASAMAAHFYKTFALHTYPDRKPKHILREIPSRILYIRLELKKRFGTFR